MVTNLSGSEASFLIEFTCAGFFDALAGFKEPCQGREHPRRPMFLASKHAPIAVKGEHDHDRVGAREMLGPTGRALPLPAALHGFSGLAADGAVLMAAA